MARPSTQKEVASKSMQHKSCNESRVRDRYVSTFLHIRANPKRDIRVSTLYIFWVAGN